MAAAAAAAAKGGGWEKGAGRGWDGVGQGAWAGFVLRAPGSTDLTWVTNVLLQHRCGVVEE